MTPKQLQFLHRNADSTLRELMDILNDTPHMAEKIKPLMTATDVLAAFQSLPDEKPELAEQLFRLTLATTVNYHTSVEIARRLALETPCLRKGCLGMGFVFSFLAHRSGSLMSCTGSFAS
jgi:hypothetical protein